MNRFLPVLLGLTLTFVLAACGDMIKKEPPPPPPPPPPSADEISAEFRGAITPLEQYLAEDAELPPGASDEALNKLRTSRAKFNGTPHFQEGVSRAMQYIGELVTRAYDGRAWALTLVAVDAVKVLEPGNTAYDRWGERALKQRNKPKVTVTSFFTDRTLDITTVWMNVYIPATQETHKVKARVGETFYGLRLLEIIGNNKGVRLEYEELQETFDVMAQ